ncbi:uncharacterized protein LOC126265728 isoform X1 [Aethina tumida]|uniref:uncharacterized protein LOC126265728 isoform X1 n=1 Tax=Aethina tumida TaxID=116153 RepID=UPI0021492C15|nr:uncharacterized protein LOC126265728 isoform X1 [Aethina tumida]
MEYFRDVVSLCQSIGIDIKQTVSCLIGGLPAHLQPNADTVDWKTPTEPYNRFLSKLDARTTEGSSTSHKRPSPRSRPHPSPRRHQQNRSHPFQGPSTRLSFHEQGRRRDKRTTDDVESRRLSGSDLKRCFNCQEVGHISRNCPRSRTNDVCRLCKERGHYAERCPKRRDVKPRFDLQRINVLQMSVPGYRKWGVTPEGNGLSVYLDTGSECNVISSECVKRIGLQTKPVQATLSGFGGGRTDANRQTQLVVTVDRCQLTVDAVIASIHLPNVDLLIGQPVLNDGHTHMEVKGQEVTLSCSTDQEAQAEMDVQLERELHLGPGATRMALVRLLGRHQGETTIPARILDDHRQPLAMSNVRFHSDSDQATVRLTNLSQSEVTICEGTSLTEVHRRKAPENNEVEDGRMLRKLDGSAVRY